MICAMQEQFSASTPTIAQYVSYWLELRKGDLAGNTHARYCTLARNQIVPYIGSLPLDRLNAACLQWLYDRLARSGGAKGDPLRTATIGQVHRFLHVCLEHAASDGILPHNPVDRIKTPRIAVPAHKTG
jgi:integrase